MYQVDPAGDGLDPVHHTDEILATRPRMAGVEAEAGAVIADRVPQSRDRVEVPGHGVVTAGGVLDQDRHGEPALVLLALEQLSPVLDSRCDFVVLADDFTGAMFKGSFQKIFTKNEQGALPMAFNATIEIQVTWHP